VGEAESEPGRLPIDIGPLGHAVVEVGHGAVRGRHGGISSNTWRAMEWLAWDVFLGQLCAELDLGTKSKVEAHKLLYKFY